jgi:hypothetical protein
VWATDNGDQGFRRRSGEGCAQEEELLWTRGARVSKEDHRAAAEHALRPGEVLRMRAGAGDAGGTRGGSGGGGTTWRGEGRASRGWGSGATDVGATRGARKGGAEAAGARHMAGEGGGGGTEKK